MNRPKKQHYIPQFLLRRFSATGDEQLWVFDKQKSIHFLSSVRDVASENYFNDVRTPDYDISFEQQLGYIEDITAPVIEEIVSTESLRILTAEKAAALIAFITTQMIRGKSWRSGMDQGWEALCEKLGGEENAMKAGVPPRDREGDKFSILNGLSKSIEDFAPHLHNKLWMLQRTRTTKRLYYR